LITMKHLISAAVSGYLLPVQMLYHIFGFLIQRDNWNALIAATIVDHKPQRERALTLFKQQ
jgi:hypothetical protein